MCAYSVIFRRIPSSLRRRYNALAPGEAGEPSSPDKHTNRSLEPNELARRLIASRALTAEAADAAPQATVEHLFRILSRWFGVDGTRALFARALTLARAEHPGLARIKVRDRDPFIEGITTKALANGDATTSEALGALILMVIQLLDRQIGPVLTTRLIVPELTETANADRSEREDAT